VARLKETYDSKISPLLVEKFNYTNPMAIPRIEKIVLNMGVGRAKENSKILDGAIRDMTSIAGQKPAWTVARKSIANFKLRAGYKIGCKATLRRERMYEFLDRLIAIVIPRIRDFRGLPRKAFDGRGNFSMGLTEQNVFPEVNLDKMDWTQGLNVTIVTTARTNEEALALLEAFGMPFKKE